MWKPLCVLSFAGLLLAAIPTGGQGDDARRLSLLFLGDNGLHRSVERAAQLIPVLERRGIDLQYTDDLTVLSSDTLTQFDGFILYAHLNEITSEQECALVEYVESGHGFIALHCASASFGRSDRYIELIGAQFETHGSGLIHTEVADVDHPVTAGYGGFTSWDETYIHRRHNDEGRTVLEYRPGVDQADGQAREPWTWVRTQGDGRVFYTAWGHDHRTWSHPGFHNLVERGIRWACGGDLSQVADYAQREPFDVPRMTDKRTDVTPFEYVDVGAKIPSYKPSGISKLTEMQQPLSPMESLKHIVVPEGFRVELFASEQDFGGKPIAMNWDERGRLWICETYDYPNELQPPGEGRDRIRICEDTDGDGRADQFTVFAENLSIPTAILHYRGGVIVQNSVETLYLKDTDADDRADVRTTLLTGWNMMDTHGGVSNFQYGHDNWIWGMQGYNDSQPVAGERKFQRFRMGFFRFKLDDSDLPTVTDLEFVRSTNNNTWGLGFSEEGLVFGSTANANPSIYLPIPNRYYERVKGWAPDVLSNMADTYLFHEPLTDKIRQVDVHGGYTAAAGHALYTARRYPQTWWNRTAFVCEPTGKLVGTFVIEPEGSGFHSTTPLNLLASDDEWTAPIMAEVGPDGNIWVIDWYNFVVQHNPTPPGFQTGRGQAYESDLRDKKHGRIYRVVYGDDSAAQPDLHDAEPTTLVETLAHPTMLWRKHAQRLLVERGKRDVVPALIELVRDDSTDELGLNVGAIHALWTLHGLETITSEGGAALQAVTDALRHPSAGVRRSALLVLPPSMETAESILNARMLDDVDAQVRLAAILKLSETPAKDDVARAMAELVADVTTMSDRWLPDAVTVAAAGSGLPFLESLAKEGTVPYRQPGTTRTPVVRVVAEDLARTILSEDDLDRLSECLLALTPDVTADVLAGLSAGWDSSHSVTLSPAAEERLLKLVERIDVASQGHLIRLANFLDSRKFHSHAERITTTLLGQVSDEALPIADRVQAASQIVQFRPYDSQVVTQLLARLTPQTPLELAEGLLTALSSSLSPELPDQLLGRIPGLTPNLRQTALGVLMGRPITTVAMIDAMEHEIASVGDLSLDQRQRLASHPDPSIRRRAVAILKRGGGLPDPDRQMVLEQLLPLAEETGDVTAGKAVFKKNCAACHTHTGEGTAVGPDLTGMAVHPKHDLLTNIIDPSRSVEANFRVYTVVTSAGEVFSGMLATETLTSLELVDSKGKRHTLQRTDIDEIVGSKKSLMPDGFEKQIGEVDIVNLLAFLSDRQQYLPLPLSTAATTVSTQGMFFDRKAKWEQIALPDWKPRMVDDVPFVLIDPQGDRIANTVLLHSSLSAFTSRLPKSVTIPCNSRAVAVHLLGGVSGMGYPRSPEGTVSMTVRLHYADGEAEDHELINGQHLADFMQHAEVPQSKLALTVGGYQLRMVSIEPKRPVIITSIELVKGPDATAPIVMAVTAQTR